MLLTVKEPERELFRSSIAIRHFSVSSRGFREKRHGVSFDAAKLVFFDPCSVTIFDRVEDG